MNNFEKLKKKNEKHSLNIQIKLDLYEKLKVISEREELTIREIVEHAIEQLLGVKK
jgi:predicted DNA-binding protein